MNPRTKHAIFSLFTALLVVFVFAISSYAMKTPSGKKGSHTIGWCCAGGKIFKSTLSMCLKHKGHFFTSHKAAVSYCDSQIPGYCCLNGKVVSSNKGNCLKKKGKFFTDKTKATSACELKGWCLSTNRIFESTKKLCVTRRGRFFTKKAEAEKALHLAKSGKQAPSSLLVPSKAPAKPSIFPLLSVARIYLKGGTVHIRLQNKGKGKLTARDYKQGKLVLRYSGKINTWRLQQIDLKRLLTKPGGKMSFDTGLVLKKREIIQFQITFKKVRIAGFKTVRLGPSKVLTQKEGKHKVFTRRVTSVAPLSRAAGVTPAKLQGKLPSLIRKPGKHNPLFIDRGIHVSLPSSTNHFMPGDTIEVHFSFEESREPLPISEVTLRNGDTIVATADVSVIPLPSREMRVELPVPADVPSNRHYTVMVRATAAIYGVSDDFQIGWVIPPEMHAYAPHGMLVSIEPRKQIYLANEHVTIYLSIPDPEFPSFRSPPGDELEKRIHLQSQSETMMGVWRFLPCTIVSLSDDRRSLILDCTLPDDLQEGGPYVMTFFNRVRFVGENESHGSSKPFYLTRGIRDAGSTTRAYGISVLSPNGGELWPKGSRQAISWRYYSAMPGDALPNFFIQLMKNGRILDTIYETDAHCVLDSDAPGPNANAYTCTVNYDVSGSYEEGDDYTIKIITGGTLIDDQSDHSFSVVPPMEVSVDGETLSLGSTPTIHCHYNFRPERINAILMNRGRRIKTILENIAALSHIDLTNHPWIIGGDCRGDIYLGAGYKIRIESRTDPRIYGESEEFRIEQPAITLGFSGSRRRFSSGDRVDIVWDNSPYCPHPCPTATASLYLSSDGRDYDCIARHLPFNYRIMVSSTIGFRWVIGSSCYDASYGVTMAGGDSGAGNMGGPGALPTGRYRLRLELDNCPSVTAYSDFFYIE